MMKKLTYMTAAVVVDQSMLAGVEDLARLMNPQTSEDLLLQSGSRYLRAHLPYQGLMGQIGDVLDSNQKEANTLLELIAKRDILFKRSVANKYDVLNKEREAVPLRYGPEKPLHRLFNSLSPVGFTTPQDDEVKEALETIRFNMPKTLGTYKGQPLNSFEKSKMEEILATSNLRRDLERVIRHPRFKKALADYQRLNLKESDGYKLNDQLFYSAVRRVFSHHKALAMRKLLLDNPQLASRVKIKQIQKQMGKTGDFTQADTIDYLLNQFPA